MVDPIRIKDPDIAIRALEMFIFEHVNYHSGAVIDLSGDVDSVLLLTLAIRALGAERIRPLVFTYQGTGGEHFSAALDWARKFGIQPVSTGLGERYDFERLCSISISDSPTVWENYVTRMKMLRLYIVANTENRLVLGSLNRSRWLLGNFTKHGDGAADVNPFGNLYRTQTLQLAKHLQLPVSVIDAPASAGFWEGQTDEKELGASYDTLDHILYHVVDRNHSPQETSERLGISERLVYDVIARIEANEHKRQPPVIAELDSL